MHLVYTPLSAFLCDIETYKIDLYSSLDVHSHRNYMKLTKHSKTLVLTVQKELLDTIYKNVKISCAKEIPYNVRLSLLVYSQCLACT